MSSWRDQTLDPLAPSQVPGLLLWLDAADAATLDWSDGGLAVWRDKSGTGSHARQGVSAARPRLAEASGSPPGRLVFDGEDDHLELPPITGIRTAIWVAQESPATPPSSALLGHPTASDFAPGEQRLMLDPELAPGRRAWLDGTEVNPYQTPTPQRLVVTSMTAGSGAAVSLLGSGGLEAGGFWAGEFGECLLFDRELGELERRRLEAYLMAKWQTAPTTRLEAVQPVPARQPTLAVDPLTGLPGVRFDGADDYLRFPTLSRVRSVVWVGRETPDAPVNYGPILGDTLRHDLHRGDGGKIYHFRAAPERVLGGETSLDGTSVDPGATRLPRRRVVLSTVANGPITLSLLGSGGLIEGFYWSGDIHEVLLFDRPLESAEREQIEAWLRHKWHLPDRHLHTSFSIRESGEWLVLTDPEGRVLDAQPPVAVPPAASYVREGPGGALSGIGVEPTPGRPNASPLLVGVTAAPLVDPPSGFFTGQTKVSITADAGAEVYYTLDGSTPQPPPAAPTDVTWFDDGLPDHAVPGPGSQSWTWVETSPPPFSRLRALVTPGGEGTRQHQFTLPGGGMPVRVGDRLFVHVYLDGTLPPRGLLVQWQAGDWEHRAFWGERAQWPGTLDTPGLRARGALPPTGGWVRLEVSAAELDLEGREVSGLALAVLDGGALWDCVGRSTLVPGTAQVYAGPLMVTTNAVVRARAFKPGEFPSPVATSTYLTGPVPQLPVVSLALEPGDFLGTEDALYATGPGASTDVPYYGANFWKPWERAVDFTLLDTHGLPEFSAGAGLRIHGGYSRSAPQKSLRLYARRKYGAGTFEHAFFPGLALDRFEVLVLRTGGNDAGKALLRDRLGQERGAGLGADASASRPVVVFINGRYWGIYTLLERADEHFLASHHGIDPDALDVIENGSEWIEGDHLAYVELGVECGTLDLAQPEAFESVAGRIDLRNFLGYHVTQIYLDNADWPTHNTLLWRPRRPDGQWRWILKDLDATFDLNEYGWERATLRVALGLNPEVAAVYPPAVFLPQMLANEEFRQEFINGFADAMNSVFLPSQLVARIDAFALALYPEIARHLERWSGSPYSVESVAAWYGEVGRLRQFAARRPAAMRHQLRDHFGLGEEMRLTIRVDDPLLGRVRVNTLRLPVTAAPWQGVYFQGVPVEVEAVPAAGCEFLAWEGMSNAPALVRFAPTGDVNLLARFRRVTEPAGPWPQPFELWQGGYRFESLSAVTPAGDYPASMVFLQTPMPDPGLDAAFETAWALPYDLTSRSRMRGLDGRGFSFLNTGNAQDSPGAGYLGAALLALRTEGVRDIQVSWVGGTVTPNERPYAIRLQYRVGTDGAFQDVTDGEGEPVEYRRSPVAGDFRRLGPVRLPAEAEGQPVVHLRWVYHRLSTGADSGARDELRVDDIRVWAQPGPPSLRFEREVGTQNGRLVVSGVPGRPAWLQSSTNLVDWADEAVVPGTLAGRTELVANLDPAAPGRFLPHMVPVTSQPRRPCRGPHPASKSTATELCCRCDRVLWAGRKPPRGWGGVPFPFLRRRLVGVLALIGTGVTGNHAGEVLLNEIMYHPASHRVDEEYLELHNRGAVAVNLAGWRLSAGVDFPFPPIVLAPGGFLVVAADGAGFSNRHPGVSNFVAGWQGRLSDNGETVTLRDALGVVQDSVTYATEGGWAVRTRGPDDHGHRGWEWSAPHNGAGSSVERINPLITGDSGQNWAPSQSAGGTPGAANSVHRTLTPPVIAAVRHSPAVPRSTEPVTVTMRVVDARPGPVQAWVQHRVDGEPAFQASLMFDDGLHGDGRPGDGELGVVLPAQPADTVVEFYVEARDVGGLVRTWPAPVQPDGAQLANCHYQVDDRIYAGLQPLYRVVLTGVELAELAAMDAMLWYWSSDAEMNATFISTEAGEVEVRYNTGFRLRGTTSRAEPVKSRRVNFSDDHRWRGVRGINLNAVNPHSQVLGSVLARKAGLPAARARAVQLRENNQQRSPTGYAPFGVYAELEVFNSDFASRQFPRDDAGNLYQAAGGGTLAYLGDTPAPYRDPAAYEKRTNTAEDDWSDLIGLTSVLNRAPPATWLEDLGRVADIPGWITYFAVNTVLANTETSLGTGGFGDYALYCGRDDPRFRLLIHDLDSVLGVSGGLDQPLLRATNNAAIHRFLTDPEVAPRYFRELHRLMDGPLAPAVVDAQVDQFLAEFVPPATRQYLKSAYRTRVDFIRAQMPAALGVSPALPLVEGIQVSSNSPVALTGLADPAVTRAVSVSGAPAAWDALTGAWALPEQALWPGINRLVVQTLDAAGAVLEEQVVRVWLRGGGGVMVAGTLGGDTTWAAGQGPYLVTADLTVPPGATLTLAPGTTVFFAANARLRVLGRLVAEGTGERRIHFGREPGAAHVWGGMQFDGSQDNRLRHVDIVHHNDPALYLTNSALLAEHVTFQGSFGNVLWGRSSSMVVRHCEFPDLPYGEHVRGDRLPPDGQWVFEGNTFGTTTGYSDVIDISGGHRPGPILQVLNNVFRGGSDDGLDLDGTDAHIEGNVFMHFHKGNDSTSESSAISTGIYDGQVSRLTVVRNVFFDNDHDLLLKEGAYLEAAHNTSVGATRASIMINEPERAWETPPQGGWIEDSLFWDTPAVVGNLDTNLLQNGTVKLSVRRSLLPESGPWAGDGNLLADPRLVNATNDFRLRAGSPAIGAAEGGRDLGAYVASGAVISGEPPPMTWRREAILRVTGPGLTHFRWRLDDGPWSDPLLVGTPVTIQELEPGEHQMSAVGLNSAGVWQPESQSTASRRWVVAPDAAGLRLNEVLAWNRNAWPDVGQFPDFVELLNDSAAPVDLAGMSLTDDPLAPRKFVFNAGTVLDPGGLLVVRLVPGATADSLTAGFGLDREGDLVQLHDRPGGRGLLGSVVFGRQLPDASVGRLADGTWSLTVPTPGSLNRAQRLGDPAGVRLNEWLAKPGPTWGSDFVEIYNPDDLPVALGGLALSTEPVGNPREQVFPPLSFLGARGYAVFLADGAGPARADHLPFRLSAEGGTLALVDADGAWLDWVEYDSQREGISQGRDPGGSGLVVDLPVPTPGTDLVVTPGAGAVVLSEVLANNRSLTNELGAASDWIELRNLTTNQISLAGMSLSDRLEDPARWVFPPTATIPPGGFLVVTCESALPASAENTGFGLSAAGESVHLFDNPGDGGGLLDTVTFGFQAADLSLARMVGQGSGWGLARATPGAENEAVAAVDPGGLRVNEWMADPGSGPDWFELFNSGDGPVTLDGVLLSDTTGNVAKYSFPALSFLAGGSGGFLLLFADEKSGDGPAHLPFKLSAEGEAILLSRPDGSRLDEVRFGAQRGNLSQGRLPDGAETIRDLTAGGSPGAANSLNAWPIFAAMPDQVAVAGEPWGWQLGAYDPDPGQSLAFRLRPPIPPGLTVAPTTGRLGWEPGWESVGQRFEVTIEATDNGVPPQTGTLTFEVRVEASTASPVWNPPWTDAAGNVHLSWVALPGVRYAVDFQPGLVPAAWVIFRDVTAGAGLVELTVPSDEAAQRFFRLRLVP